MDDDDQREDRRRIWSASAVLVLMATVAALVLGDWWLARRVPAPASERSAAAPASGCTLAIGPEFPPAAAALTVAPGETVIVIATCALDVTVVDLVIALPPPQGAMFVWTMERLRETPAGVLWRWAAEMTPDAAGLSLTFYGYADGRLTGEPVTLTVTRS